MGAPEVIAVIAAGGIVGIALLRRQQQAAAGPCDGLTGDALLACQAASLLGQVAGAVTTNVAGALSNERDRRRANNDKLNGPALTGLDSDAAGDTGGDGELYNAPVGAASAWENVNPVATLPLRYANGCEPYYGAPGWSKCAAGTLDMYEMAVEQTPGAGGLEGVGAPLDEAHATVPQSFETPAALAAATANNEKNHDENDSHWYQISLGRGYSPRPVEPLKKQHYGTGASGDPLTWGPWVDGGGQIWWLVRGKRFAAPAGKVPLAIAIKVTQIGFQTEADRDAKIIALTDAQATSLIGVGTYGAGSGTGTTTTIDCSNVVNSTLTWDTSNGGFWRRMRAGETQRNLGPCAKSQQTNAAGEIKQSTIGAIGGIFGVGE